MTNELELCFRFAEPRMIKKLKLLWKCCFGDSDEYIGLFFDERFVPEQCLTAVCGDDIAGMLFLLPLTMVSNGKSYEARYIYAVATAPEYRSRGVSTRLLEAAHDWMRENGIAMSLLVPAEDSLFEYYGKRGFKTEFFCREIEFKADTAAQCDLEAVSLQKLLPERDKAFEKSVLYARWDEAALGYQQMENEFLGGETLKFSSPQEGYAVCCPTEDTVLIKEWAADKIYPEVIGAIAARYEKPTARVRIAADKGAPGARGFAMTMWYNTERRAPEGTAPCFSLVLD